MAQAPKRRARALLTVVEVSERLHVSVAVVMAAVDAGVLPHVREDNGQLRFHADEIDGIEIRAEK
jgi:excisionase family DNA binding protein